MEDANKYNKKIHTYIHTYIQSTQYIYTHVFCVEKCIFLTSVHLKHIYTTEL